ncbi:unnamed protein product, partial [Amoebophrya sp. A25]|eukprot:GSA25T00026837001.1
MDLSSFNPFSDPEEDDGFLLSGFGGGGQLAKRLKQATYTTTETYDCVTPDHEDHTFCGIMFDLFCRGGSDDAQTKNLPIEYLEVKSIGVRGTLGKIQIFVTKPKEVNPAEEQACGDGAVTSSAAPRASSSSSSSRPRLGVGPSTSADPFSFAGAVALGDGGRNSSAALASTATTKSLYSSFRDKHERPWLWERVHLGTHPPSVDSFLLVDLYDPSTLPIPSKISVAATMNNRARVLNHILNNFIRQGGPPVELEDDSDDDDFAPRRRGEEGETSYVGHTNGPPSAAMFKLVEHEELLRMQETRAIGRRYLSRTHTLDANTPSPTLPIPFTRGRDREAVEDFQLDADDSEDNNNIGSSSCAASSGTGSGRVVEGEGTSTRAAGVGVEEQGASPASSSSHRPSQIGQNLQAGAKSSSSQIWMKEEGNEAKDDFETLEKNWEEMRQKGREQRRTKRLEEERRLKEQEAHDREQKRQEQREAREQLRDELGLKQFPQKKPLRLYPGETRGIYVHSSGPAPDIDAAQGMNRFRPHWAWNGRVGGTPDSIVYNNQRSRGITMENEHVRVLPGIAHTADEAFSQNGYW